MGNMALAGSPGPRRSAVDDVGHAAVGGVTPVARTQTSRFGWVTCGGDVGSVCEHARDAAQRSDVVVAGPGLGHSE